MKGHTGVILSIGGMIAIILGAVITVGSLISVFKTGFSNMIYVLVEGGCAEGLKILLGGLAVFGFGHYLETKKTL